MQQYIQTVTRARRRLADDCVYRVEKLREWDYKEKIDLGTDGEWNYWFENGNVWRSVHHSSDERIKPIIIVPGRVRFLNLGWYNENNNLVDGLVYAAEQIEMVWKNVHR